MSDFATLGRVEAIRQLFEGSGYTPFKEPLSFSPKTNHKIVNSSVLLLEGTDFNLVYFPLKHLGYKSVVIATGELQSKLAVANTLSITLGVSSKLDFEEIKTFWSGVIISAKEFGYQQLSLELLPSKNGLAISVNASGEASDNAFINAKSKDLICVSSRLAAAYLGQQVLEHKANELEKYKMLVGAYLKPELSTKTIALFNESGIKPSSGLFIRRGLSDAVLRLCRDNNLGAKIYADRIPFEANSFALGKELNIDPISAAMNGGDECCLLFTIPLSEYEKFRTDFQVFDIIGHLAQTNVGAVLVTPDGLEHELSSQGW